MKCKACGKTIEEGLEFCYFCGESFENFSEIENLDGEINETGIYEEKEADLNYDENEEYHSKSSTVGMVVKVLSIIVLVLSVIGSFVMMEESVAIGLVMLLVSVLTSLLAYGIGEIVCLLTAINYKL